MANHSTGLFIPIEKQSMFILAFEDFLIKSYNSLPLFTPSRWKNLCEITLNYIGLPTEFGLFTSFSDFDKAKKFLQDNLQILDETPSANMRKSRNRKTVNEVIDLDSFSSPKSISLVDLTEPDSIPTEPEIIVLDETLSQLNKTLVELETTIDCINDDNVINLDSLSTRSRKIINVDDEVEILSIKEHKKHSTPKILSKIKILKESFSQKKNKSNSSASGNDFCVVINKNNRRSVRMNRKQSSKTDSLVCTNASASSFDIPAANPKRNLQVSDNILQLTSSNSAFCSPVKNNVLKYYSNLNNVLEKARAKNNTKSNANKSKTEHRLNVLMTSSKKSTKKKKKKSITRAVLNQLQNYTNAEKIAGLISQTRSSNQEMEKMVNFNHGKLKAGCNNSNNAVIKGKGSGCKVFETKSLRKKDKKNTIVTRSVFNELKRNANNLPNTMTRSAMMKVGDMNTFNPNPNDVNKVGLRPIIIDGCNIANGHGKGKFSCMGVKICVDYFVNKGHDTIKVFLPQHRKEFFGEKLLTELQSKCDMVFTPNRCLGGRTPYDDRFIVQYADMFGGVIVSTDNYRDLLRENPSWRETISHRLLMFTWVDDLLMFPMDPLGRDGPTLEQFLMF